VSRTKGARDIRKRKNRRIKGKKYSKHGNKFVPYVSKRNRNDPVRIWWWERRPISKEGLSHFNKKVRPFMCRTITKFSVRVDVLPSELSNEKKIEELAINTLSYPGVFLLMMPCHSKNAWRVSYKKVAKVIIRESPEGLNAKMTDNYRLFRYFFWKN